MKVTLNPQYKSLRDEIPEIVENFSTRGEVIYTGRNEIRVVETADGIKLNVKRYRVPILPNRLIYSLFRKPKGLRSFQYAPRLVSAGIDTPEAVAYVEQRKFGLIGLSYLITLQSPLTRRLYEFGDKSMTNPEDIDIIRRFARFTARMHEAEILHRDYSPGNILFDTDNDGNVVFSVVDTNRMVFEEVSLRQGVENFARLWGQPEMFNILVDEYCIARGKPEMKATARQWIVDARKKFWSRFSKRHKVKFNLRY